MSLTSLFPFSQSSLNRHYTEKTDGFQTILRGSLRAETGVLILKLDGDERLLSISYCVQIHPIT